MRLSRCSQNCLKAWIVTPPARETSIPLAVFTPIDPFRPIKRSTQSLHLGGLPNQYCSTPYLKTLPNMPVTPLLRDVGYHFFRRSRWHNSRTRNRSTPAPAIVAPANPIKPGNSPLVPSRRKAPPIGVPVKTPIELRLKKAPSRAPIFLAGEIRTMIDGMMLMYTPEQKPEKFQHGFRTWSLLCVSYHIDR